MKYFSFVPKAETKAHKTFVLARGMATRKRKVYRQVECAQDGDARSYVLIKNGGYFLWYMEGFGWVEECASTERSEACAELKNECIRLGFVELPYKEFCKKVY